MKSRLCACSTSFVEILAAGLEEPAGGVLGGPAAELDAGLAGGRQLELLAAPGGLHHLPGIAGRGGRVDDDRPRRALARGALVLVGPAAVVEPAVAGEELRIPVGIVVEHHQDLALEVHALEVVPLVLGRLDAVADEDQLGVLEAGGRLLHAAGADVVVPPLQVDGLAAGLEAPGLRHVGLDADDLEGLLPLAVGEDRLVAEELESRGEIELRGLVATAGRPAPFQQVVRQEADGRLERGAVDRLRGPLGAGGELDAGGGTAFFSAPVSSAGIAARARPIPRLPSQACRFGIFIYKKPPWVQRLPGRHCSKVRRTFPPGIRKSRATHRSSPPGLQKQ